MGLSWVSLSPPLPLSLTTPNGQTMIVIKYAQRTGCLPLPLAKRLKKSATSIVDSVNSFV